MAIEKMGRTINAKRNIIFALIKTIVSLISPFTVRTILVYQFGAEYLGLNSLFGSILGVLSLMELGFGTAVVYSMYKPIAENNISLICKYIAFYRKIYRIIGCVIFLAGLILIPFLGYIVKDAAITKELNIVVCYLIFLSNTIISYWLYGYITAIPTAYQRSDILSKIEIGVVFLQSATGIIVLFLSKNYYFYLLTLPLFTVIRNLVAVRIVKKQYPDLKCEGELDEAQKQDLRKKVLGLLVNKVTGVSRNGIDSLCISIFIGLSYNGIYNNYYYIMTGLVSLSISILSSMMASVGNSIATESVEKNYSDMRMFDFIYTSISGWITVCLLCLYQPFIKMWVGTDMMLPSSAVIALSAYFYILKSGDIRWVYHEGTGLWHECRFIMIGEAFVNIILNIALCKIWGLFGIIIATVISVFFSNYIFCPQVLFRLYFNNQKIIEYWFDHCLYTVVMLAAAILSWFMCEKYLPISMVNKETILTDIICLSGRFIICTVISVIIFLLIWFKSQRLKTAAKRIKQMVKAK